MPDEDTSLSWDFDSAINLLSKLSLTTSPRKEESDPLSEATSDASEHDGGVRLGDFNSIWDLLGSPRVVDDDYSKYIAQHEANDASETDLSRVDKAIRWRDEDGADLEDNIEPETTILTKNQKRAARRARARERTDKSTGQQPAVSDTETGRESDDELESLRRSPDRTSVIASILGRKRPGADDNSPPTSPSPPKAYTTPKKERPISQPFIWTAPGVPSLYHRHIIAPRDGLTNLGRKQDLISKLKERFPDEKKYLKSTGLIEPTFTSLNVSDIGIHVFIDISNISIGFHDCLKLSRGLPRETRIKRISMSFHNFSLVLERGRPAAKRVLVGSDKSSVVDEAKVLGFETNILERVHKAKEPTPSQKRFNTRSGGETSGSETNTGITPRAERWVEQAVDEILHLKILESLIDHSDKPSTIVLATGDAAEAEYSGGFLRMVERALEKGWMVELVSFKLNTSSLYKRKEFRARWGRMFKWIQLDDYAEMLIDQNESS